MTARSRVLYALFMLLFCASGLRALEITQGRIKLILHEGIGRFSLSYLTDVKGSTWKPLLLDKDPRTSVTSIAVGNKVYRLGESSDFREAVERTESGARFTWTSPLLTVSQEFSFVSSKGSSLANGVRIDMVLKNTSEQVLSVGVRYLFDTYLGEASYVHFKTDKIPEISRELTLSKADKALYWVSPLVGDPNQIGLMCMLYGEGISIPDRVVFANWKRLNDASWSFETSGTRNFNLLPYSVNDSAVSHYFDPRDLPRGTEWRVVTVMGMYDQAGYDLGSAALSAEEANASLKEALNASKDIQDIALAASTDLSTVNRLIASIDRALSSGKPYTDDELAAIAQVIAELKERSLKFEKGAGK